jgi:hypothetical protein
MRGKISSELGLPPLYQTCTALNDIKYWFNFSQRNQVQPLHLFIAAGLTTSSDEQPVLICLLDVGHQPTNLANEIEARFKFSAAVTSKALATVSRAVLTAALVLP